MKAGNKKAPQQQAPQHSVLEDAADIISGQRAEDYGSTLESFTQIAMAWNAMLARKLLPDGAISALDVARCMIAMKLCRLATAPQHRDSWVDVAGYAGCAEFVQQSAPAEDAVPGTLLDAAAMEIWK